MTGLRHAYLLMAVLAAAMTLNWAATAAWGRALLSLLLTTAAYTMAEHVLERK